MPAIKIDFQGQNRRQDDRYPLVVPAFLLEPAVDSVDTIDVSEHGIAFFSTVRLERGQLCQFVFKATPELQLDENLVLPVRVQDVVEEGMTCRISCMLELRKFPEPVRSTFERFFAAVKKNGIPSWSGMDSGDIPIPSGNSDLQFWEQAS